MAGERSRERDQPLRFAAEVLGELLAAIDRRNQQRWTVRMLISHAWADATAIYLVYTNPPATTIWGLARDTRASLIDPGPWPDAATAAHYYGLLDLGDATAMTGAPADHDTITWHGDHTEGLPQRQSTLRDDHRYEAPSAETDDGAVAPSVLAAKVRDLAALLHEEGQDNWARWLDNDARRIDTRDIYGVRHLLSAFGGMGSLTDLPLAAQTVRQLSEVAALADEAWRDAQRPGPNRVVINEPRRYADPRKRPE